MLQDVSKGIQSSNSSMQTLILTPTKLQINLLKHLRWNGWELREWYSIYLQTLWWHGLFTQIKQVLGEISGIMHKDMTKITYTIVDLYDTNQRK